MVGWTPTRFMLRGILHATQQAISRKRVRPVPLPRPYRKNSRVVSTLAGMPGAVRRVEPTEED